MSAGLGGHESSGQESEEEGLTPARENPILRAYFRRQFADIRSFRSSRRPGNDRFMEDLIDDQIDHYVSQLSEKLVLLKVHFDEVKQGGEDISRATSAQERREAKLNWNNALKEVQDLAGDLWNMLRYIFVDLEDKGNFKPSIDTPGSDSPFEKETRFIGEQIKKADERISQYFFESEDTISLEDLRGENMLIHLFRVREMAKRIRQVSR